METKVYQKIASLVDARLRCIKNGNTEWESRHEENIESLVKNHLPSGSGFDSGTEIDLEKSTGEKLVFNTSFHHMNENGYYDGWTEHMITITPSLMFGFSMRISGRDRNGIKEYIDQSFYTSLTEDIEDAKGEDDSV